MKKQNILDLLAQDKLNEIKIKEDNFHKCINNFDEYIEKYIKPYLINNQERFDYKFDLESEDENIKKQSESLLKTICFLFEDLVSVGPELYLSLLEEKDTEYACSGICFYILMGNITIIKKELANSSANN